MRKALPDMENQTLNGLDKAQFKLFILECFREMDIEKNKETDAWKGSYKDVNDNIDAYIEVLFTKIFQAQDKSDDGNLIVDEVEILKFITLDLNDDQLKSDIAQFNPVKNSSLQLENPNFNAMDRSVAYDEHVNPLDMSRISMGDNIMNETNDSIINYN